MRASPHARRNAVGSLSARLATRTTLRAAVVAALILGLAACGGSSRSNSTAHQKMAGVQAPVMSGTGAASMTPSRSTSAKPQTNTTRTATTHTTARHTTATHTKTTRSRTTHTKTTITHTKTSKNPRPKAPAYARPMHATLVGENHHPTANEPWSYTVTATDANGRPLPGTADTEFAFNGVVVGHETPPTHSLLDGRLHDSVTFPAAAVGQPIDLQVVVHTRIGSLVLVWPVKVRKVKK